MFTRVVEIEAKSGKSDEAISKLRNEVVPVLQKQPGFIDLIALRDHENPQRVMCLSFWNSKESATHYHREHYDSIVQALRSVLEATPTLDTLQVEISTPHRIAIGRAA